MKLLNNVTNQKVYKFGIIYIVIITIIAAIANYFTWHAQITSQTMFISVFIVGFILWIGMYFPVFIFMKKDKWKLEDFGICLNKKLTIGTLLLTTFILWKIGLKFSVSNLPFAVVEAFARVGEEIFYRGFIYAFVLKLFANKRKPWILAVIISSFLFTIMHTQTFLPENSLNMFSIFMTSVLLALFRHWTDSILLGIILHCVSNGGIETMLIGMIIYFIFLIITVRKKRESNYIQEDIQTKS